MATSVQLPTKAKTAAVPTLDEIKVDRITQLAQDYWAPHPVKKQKPFDPAIVELIYTQEIKGTKFNVRRIMMLEVSQYLENYLWPNYVTGESSYAHMMSVVVMMNEKFRERVMAWTAVKKDSTHLDGFLNQVLHGVLEQNSCFVEKTALTVFLTNTFNSIEVDIIRDHVKRLLSLSTWVCLHQLRREYELSNAPKWRKNFNKILKKENESRKENADWERRLLYNLMLNFLNHLEAIPLEGDIEESKVQFCERFLELLIDLEASLPTRRFFNVLLDDCQLVLRCKLSNLAKRSEGKLFLQLMEILKFYSRFEINDVTGDCLTDAQMSRIHYDSVTSLQKAIFAKFPSMLNFALANVASIDTRDAILKHFSKLEQDNLRSVLVHLNLVPPKDRESEEHWYKTDTKFLLELLAFKHERRISQLMEINNTPLYPTEDIIWDENIVPSEYYSGEGCLALPKLNLQFLTLHDYLLRNLNLFRLESTYEIKQDIEDGISRLSPWKNELGGVYFGGWARMAQPIVSFVVVEVTKPNIGEAVPSRVRADVTVNLNVKADVKAEWENLRKHDVCFLVAIKPTMPIGTKYNFRLPFLEQSGVKYVRGCEIEGMLDNTGKIIEDIPDVKPELEGDTRTFRVILDSNQYKLDMELINEGEDDFYENFNVILRRKPKENNFKAVLQTIRELMNTDCIVPDWLHDILLGYGDPGSAHYTRMPNEIATMDFNDTFLNMDHLRSSFPGYEIKVKVDDPKNLVPPFKLTFEDVLHKHDETKPFSRSIVVEPHVIPNRGPYPSNVLKRNSVWFTPTQIEAIRSGMQPGLTMVVGPPGTGKTDVAVQIISNIYHNFPNQRTLIVTHSNQALNQLFEKIIMLDVEDRHLLRLGHGEGDLETEKDFSRYGRVNYVLAKRIELLEDVERLQKCLGVEGDMAYTCETARYFYLSHVYAKWEQFKDSTAPRKGKTVPVEKIGEEFPFKSFFADAPQPLFKGTSYEEDMDKADGCFRHIEKIFTQLEEFRAFELLRSGPDRSKYLLVKEAKIIAMTCTHAALKRSELVDIGFKYDNILMEEAAQILEIETFIPLLVQTVQDGFNRLKRWIMIGDHNQLPPVIKNMAFQKYSNMEQSLFTRLVRLGVPTVDLDAQGRARPSICDLYKWRYKNLGNLPHVVKKREYQVANAGFRHEYQFINVEDFNGVGESEPSPYFYQNLAEAEYCVAVFMFMRLLGYPAHKITILTTYNGQKHLIRDVVNARCASNPLIGKPHKVTTVDKYQGQQNDYVLLSLVRTRAVGHLRDVRRLIVALSRARLGLYIFGRSGLFFNCFELRMAMDQLAVKPLHLQIYPAEQYPTMREVDHGLGTPPETISGMTEMASFVYKFYQDKVASMKQIYYQSKKEWYRPGEQTGRAPENFVSSHPGAGSDSDDDDEQEARPKKSVYSAAPKRYGDPISETKEDPVVEKPRPTYGDTPQTYGNKPDPKKSKPTETEAKTEQKMETETSKPAATYGAPNPEHFPVYQPEASEKDEAMEVEEEDESEAEDSPQQVDDGISDVE
ncbi:Aquarius homolog (Mouse) [Nesidiocoris tenuis]|uniref:Aquarius homolog (Mouse) n=1 Tax=Nesidiocoris tenuis TaxID=355587 RepID=A0ABN7BDB6_9HEMI|nr:Aquarius homolog (Mouse) [Nesidiocoris tenuis]